MRDTITTIGASAIQHGPHNDRVYLMKLDADDYPGIIGKLYALADENGYSKIFAKVPAYAKAAFEKDGYLVEAEVSGFFNGRDDAFFMGRYLSGRRMRSVDSKLLDEVLTIATSRANDEPEFTLPPRHRLRVLGQEDAGAVAEVYKKTFETYPFPIFDPEYIAATMEHNVVYFGIFSSGKLAAAASCEMDIEAQNMEMTDFAALPRHSGRGFSVYILSEMERAMREQGMITAYTISRAASHQINITFARMGYRYAGTLINNTNIAGRLESMNVWHKRLITESDTAS